MSKTIIETVGINCNKLQIIKLYGYIITVERFDEGITYSLYKREAFETLVKEDNSSEETKNVG